MNYEELLADIASKNYRESRTLETPYAALRAVVELCQRTEDIKITGVRSTSSISTELLIQTIEQELA